MLGKLLKHDWKRVWKTIICLNGVILIMTLLGDLSLLFNFWNTNSNITSYIAVLCTIFYMLSMIGLCVAIVIYLIVYMYRSCYSDAGYLTHTLPVKSSSIILSKLIILSAGYLITGATVIISVFSLMLSLGSIGGNISLSSAFSELSEEIRLAGIADEIWLSIILLVIFILAAVFFSSSIIMASFSFGQLYTKHKIVGSVVSYFAIETIIQILVTLISIPVFVSNITTLVETGDEIASVGSFFLLTYILTIVITIGLSVGLFFISNHIMKKKLNLD